MAKKQRREARCRCLRARHEAQLYRSHSWRASQTLWRGCRSHSCSKPAAAIPEHQDAICKSRLEGEGIVCESLRAVCACGRLLGQGLRRGSQGPIQAIRRCPVFRSVSTTTGVAFWCKTPKPCPQLKAERRVCEVFPNARPAAHPEGPERSALLGQRAPSHRKAAGKQSVAGMQPGRVNHRDH